MKKIKIGSLVGLIAIGFLNAQSFNPKYPNDLYRYTNEGTNIGTARYTALNGSMGALGGDLSSTIDNPAGAAVFLTSEASLSLGIQESSLNTTLGSYSSNMSENKVNLNQAGGVMVFNNYSDADSWKNFVISLNYQQNRPVNEEINLRTNIFSENSATNTDKLEGIFYKETGSSSLTNLSFAGNYNDKLYFGLGFNFYQFNNEIFRGIQEFNTVKSLNYVKDYSPNMTQGSGFSIGLGFISRINNNVRLGLAYESPKWYKDISESFLEYDITDGIDSQGQYFVVKESEGNYFHDLTSGQKFTGSAAFIFSKKGLINIDYTYNDLSSAKFRPSNSSDLSTISSNVYSFNGENQYLNNYVKGNSILKIGAETRVKDLSLRAGFRYQQSPFQEITLDGVKGTYRPFGDLTSFSLGLGYNLKSFYIDAAYSFSQRDRNYLLHGLYYNNKASVNFEELIPGATDSKDKVLQNAAREFLRVNTAPENSTNNFDGKGYARSLKNINQKFNNFSITVGLRF